MQMLYALHSSTRRLTTGCSSLLSPSLHLHRQNMSLRTMQLPQYCSLNHCYFIHPQIQATVTADSDSQSIPRPVVLLNGANIKAQKLESIFSDFEFRDDVFSKDFLDTCETIVVQDQSDDNEKLAASANTQDLTERWTIQRLVHASADTDPLPEGPYFLVGKNIHQAWKMYADDLDSLSVAVVPEDVRTVNTNFSALASLHPDGIWKQVAVPSRLYSSRTAEKPLAGKRITIKDNYRLAGVKTTLSSRPYEATYGREKETAEFVKRLLGLGAVVVGKSKMSAFASSEEPTDQWVDFHAPFNPRGDGYQTPAGSSNGAAAALSGYPWLDFSIGTDTSGSIRYPAAICGLYGLRYTSHTIPLDGLVPCCREFDAVGVLGRDIDTLSELVSLTALCNSGDPKRFPKRVLYPTDFLPYNEEPVQAILEEFVKKLEAFLETERTVFSIADRWEQCKPQEAENKTIKEFLAKTGFNPFYYDGYHIYDDFRSDHESKFNSEVYVGPYMRWKWETGSKVTPDDVQQSMDEMKVYRKWFADNVLKEGDEAMSDAILIMPVSCYAPDYRDTIHGPSGSISSFSEGYTASILRLPQFVVPVGQVKYESRVSGRTEYHPITVGLVGASGSDTMLVELTKEVLKHAGWPTVLRTGKSAWEPGNNVLNVGSVPKL